MTFEGPSYRTICQADGRWSHPLPRCYGQSSPSCSPFSLSRDIFDRQIIASNPPICGVTAGPCPHSKTQKCRYQYCSYKVTQKSMRPASIQVLCPTHGTGFVERLGTSLCKKKEFFNSNLTFNIYLHTISYDHPENTHRWGKYHCMDGLQFYKFGLNCLTTY